MKINREYLDTLCDNIVIHDSINNKPIYLFLTENSFDGGGWRNIYLRWGSHWVTSRSNAVERISITNEKIHKQREARK